MKKSRFSESQILAILTEGGSGIPVAEVCRKHGISSPTYYQWKGKYAGMSLPELKRVPGLRERKPCDGKMNGGNQPAAMSMIHRRHSSLTVGLPVCLKPLGSVYRSAARMLAVQVDKKGHMKNQFPAPVAQFFCAVARDRPVPALSIPYQRYRQR